MNLAAMDGIEWHYTSLLPRLLTGIRLNPAA
jgi:hypothetical protein